MHDWKSWFFWWYSGASLGWTECGQLNGSWESANLVLFALLYVFDVRMLGRRDISSVRVVTFHRASCWHESFDDLLIAKSRRVMIEASAYLEGGGGVISDPRSLFDRQAIR